MVDSARRCDETGYTMMRTRSCVALRLRIVITRDIKRGGYPSLMLPLRTPQVKLLDLVVSLRHVAVLRTSI